jgi:small-conductance mechanosensitive channel
MIEEIRKEIRELINCEHPFSHVISEIADWVYYLWHYTLYESVNQPIEVSNILIATLLFVVGLKTAKILSIWVRNKAFKTGKVEMSVAYSLERIFHYIFIALVSVFVLDITNVPLTAFTVVGTTIAVAIGVGSQTLANNFISGIVIMIEEPIKLDDIIEIKNMVGKVTNIGARGVSLCTDNNVNMLIPNRIILEETIVNWTMNDSTIRTMINVHIEHGCNIKLVDELLYKVLKGHDAILKTPPPRIILSEVSSVGIDFEVEFWINLKDNIEKKYIVNDLNRTMLELFMQNNIKIVKIEQVDKWTVLKNIGEA